MLRFPQMTSPQKFASAHTSAHNHVASEHHLVERQTYNTRGSARQGLVA